MITNNNIQKIYNTFTCLFLIFLILYYRNLTIKILRDDISIVICFFLFPLIISFIVYKKITFAGYFLGFITQWIIFLNVNPYPLNQNNKLFIMSLIPEKHRPETQFSLSEINNKQFNYPIIIKPIVCSGDGKNVQIIYSNKELRLYLKNCKNVNSFMVQNYLYKHNIEIGILWEKYPWENKGRIVEIVEKTQNTKIRNYDYKYHKNLTFLIDDKLNYYFNEIAKSVKNMNVCRYDVRVENIQDLQTGDFKILEINGTMGMSYLGYPIKNGFLIDIKWYFIRLIIGLYNIITLQGYSPIKLPIVMYKSYLNTLLCKEWEDIFSLYS